VRADVLSVEEARRAILEALGRRGIATAARGAGV
jgi:hypothetical protein